MDITGYIIWLSQVMLCGYHKLCYVDVTGCVMWMSQVMLGWRGALGHWLYLQCPDLCLRAKHGHGRLQERLWMCPCCAGPSGTLPWVLFLTTDLPCREASPAWGGLSFISSLPATAVILADILRAIHHARPLQGTQPACWMTWLPGC